MPGFLTALLQLPSLIGKLLDWLADRQKRQERAAMKAEASAAAAVEIERVQLAQEKDTRDAMENSNRELPDRDAAAQRLRDGQF